MDNDKWHFVLVLAVLAAGSVATLFAVMGTVAFFYWFSGVPMECMFAKCYIPIDW